MYLSITQAKQIINLLLFSHFYPVILYRRVQRKKKATNYYIQFGRSLWSAISCQRKWLAFSWVGSRISFKRKRILSLSRYFEFFSYCFRRILELIFSDWNSNFNLVQISIEILLFFQLLLSNCTILRRTKIIEIIWFLSKY